MARRRSAAHLHLVAPLPEPVAPLAEPAARVPEPAASLPEPADSLPEPAAPLPEPVEGPRRGQRPSLREPAQAPKPVEERKRELLAIISTKPWSCAACGGESGRGGFLTMDDAGPLCLDCADLGHLEFLPSGDAALVCPSGQLPGAVSATPTRTDGSTAFMAAL